MRIRRIALVATAMVASLGLAACSAQGTPENTVPADNNAEGADLTVQTADGTEVTLDAVPQRVVVLDYASLDTIDAIGKGDVIVGVPQKTLPESLQSYKDTTDVGTLKEVDYEALASTNPDLIIAGGRQEDQLDKLGEIAPTINMASDPKHFVESSITRIEDLAGVFGKQDAVAEKVTNIKNKVEELKKTAGEKGTTMFLMSSGGKLSTYGPGSRYGYIFDELGFKAADPNSENQEGHGQEVSFEYVAEKNPDRIIVLDRDAAIGAKGESAKQVLSNSLVDSTNAAKNDAIVYVDPVNWYLVTGGANAMDAMLTELTDSLK